MSKASILIIIFFCAFLNCIAQEPIRYTTKQGLPSNHIYDIQEDADGFMWFATNRGLVKYDGETFKTFTIKDGLPNNDTWLLETDMQGRLWYFSKSNYQGYIKNDSIYKFPVEDNLVISPRFIHKSKNRLWLHSGGGYHTLKKDTLLNSSSYGLKSFSSVSKKMNALSNTYKFNLTNNRFLFNPENEEIIVIKNKEILFFDTSYKLIKKQNTLFEFDINITNSFGLLYNQTAYFASRNGVLFIDFKTKTTLYYSFKKLVGVESIKYIKCKGLKDEIQVSIPGHLLTFNYDLAFKNSYSFSEDLGRMSYKDSKENIWLADFANGITLQPNTQLQTQYFLQNKKIQKINKIDNVFYAGVNVDGFYKLNSTKNQFENFIKLKKATGEIYQINKGNTNNPHFISSANSYVKNNTGVANFSIKNKTIYNNTNQTSFKNVIFYNDFMYCIAGGSIFKSDVIFKLATVFSRKDGLINSAIFKNRLFFGGSDGLHVEKNDTLTRTFVKHPLLEVSIANFLSTKEQLIVGTDGRGVYMYDHEKVLHLKKTDGYSIQKVIKKEGALWVATNNGVHKIELDPQDIENSNITDSFYETDGLLQNNTNDIYLENNNLYAASDIGLAKLNVNNTLYKQKPSIYFKTKNDTLNYTKEERDNINLTFASKEYANQEYIRYQFRLLPGQKEWVTTKTKNLNFSNLSPNIYTLEVKATDQHFNTSIASQHLNVIPKWWQTIMAKIGFGIVGFMVLLGFVKILQVRIQNKEKEKATRDKRISGLELQALRSQMNPHFVHNSLNAIQYFIQRKEVELSENYLSKFSKLIRLFFEYSRRQTVSVNEEIDLLKKYLEIEKLRFEEKLSYSIQMNDEFDADELEIPSMLLQPIVENAVNHGVFHKQGKGHIDIEFTEIDESSFKVIVKDDGIGIHKTKAMFKASSKNYQSNSSQVLKERIDLLNKGKTWKIEYSIKDISDIDTSKTGTIAQLIFSKPIVS